MGGYGDLKNPISIKGGGASGQLGRMQPQRTSTTVNVNDSSRVSQKVQIVRDARRSSDSNNRIGTNGGEIESFSASKKF